jgi:hypothetical protein
MPDKIPFDEFWGAYPRKVGRFKAEKIWAKMTTLERVAALHALSLWKQTYQWTHGGGLYIPHGSTFLGQRRYEDEPWVGAFEEVR